MKEATKYLYEKLIDLFKFVIGSDEVRWGRRKYSFAKLILLWLTFVLVPLHLFGAITEATLLAVLLPVLLYTVAGFFGANTFEHVSAVFKKKEVKKSRRNKNPGIEDPEDNYEDYPDDSFIP